MADSPSLPGAGSQRETPPHLEGPDALLERAHEGAVGVGLPVGGHDLGRDVVAVHEQGEPGDGGVERDQVGARVERVIVELLPALLLAEGRHQLAGAVEEVVDALARDAGELGLTGVAEEGRRRA